MLKPIIFCILTLAFHVHCEFVATKKSEIIIADPETPEATANNRNKIENEQESELPVEIITEQPVEPNSEIPTSPPPLKPTFFFEDEPGALVLVFTNDPSTLNNYQPSDPGYFARAIAVERIVKRMATYDRSKHAALNLFERLPLRFRFVDVAALERKSGWELFDEILTLIENPDSPWLQVIGVVIETLPSPDVAWAQILYESVNSLRLPIVVSDTRGPTFSPSSLYYQDEDGDLSRCDKLHGLGLGSGMGNVLSTMPSQSDLDAGMLEVVYAILKTSRFAIVQIDHDDRHEGSALSSTIEELLNAATHRDQTVRLFRLKGHKIDAENGWESAIKEVSNRHKKFVLFSQRPEYERKFIHKALQLGLAGRGFMYISMNFDFHLDPLNVPCSVGDHTSVSAIRLRKTTFRNGESSEEVENEEAAVHADEEFQTVVLKSAMDTFSKAVNVHFESNKYDDECSKFDIAFLTRCFEHESQGWVLELLNMTNDGYFVRLQYMFPIRRIQWILNPSLSGSSLYDVAPADMKRRRRLAPFMTREVITSNDGHTHDVHNVPCQNNRRLRITTILEQPFIMRKKTAPPSVNGTMRGMSGNRPGVIGSKLVQAKRFGNRTYAREHTGIEEFEGYCIDLLEKLSEELGFSYDLTLVPDSKYGSLTETGRWNGMIGELEQGHADVAVAPLTITQAVVDFTQSFMTLGIGMLYWRQDLGQESDGDNIVGMFSFFRPLKWEVWLSAGAALLFYSFAHRVICLFSPVERTAPPSWTALLNPTKPPSLHSPKPLWTLSNSVWLAVSTILQQGCDFFPFSKSTRLLYITWGFVSLLLCSCYTANLAAFLTNERLETPLRKATDLLGQNKTKYGTLFGGSTQSFFKNSKIDIFREMYANMARDQTLVAIQNDGIKRVIQSKGKFAFFLESTKLEYEVARDCRLTQVGGLLDSKGYGIATQKGKDMNTSSIILNVLPDEGSPLRDLLSTTILKLQNEGELQRLRNKWWIEEREINTNIKCPGDSNDKASAALGRRSASKLSLEVLGGAFIVLLGGLGLGIAICLIEFVFYGLSFAIRRGNGCALNKDALLRAWKFHLGRVYSVGVGEVLTSCEHLATNSPSTETDYYDN